MKKKTVSITSKAAKMTILQSLLLMAVILFISAGFFYRIVTNIYDEMAAAIADAALGSVDGSELYSLAAQVNEIIKTHADPAGDYARDPDAFVREFSGIQESETYKKVWHRLNALRRGTGSTALDYVLLYPDRDEEVFILDACDVNVLPCGEVHVVDLEHYRGEPRQDFDGFATRSSTYGRLRTDGVAVFLDDSNGIYAYLLADIPISTVMTRLRFFLLNTILTAAAITLILAFLFTRHVKKQVVTPIARLKDQAQEFVGNYEIRASLHDETHFFDKAEGGGITEFAELAQAMQSMELEMNSYLKDLDGMISERAKIDTELELARNIQTNLLPNIFPPFPDRKEFDIYASMDPAKEVGGDFYDFFFVDEDHLGLVIADVSGKGIPAALFMMVAKALIKTRLQSGESPAAALTNVNDQICANNPSGMFVTVWLSVLELSTGKGLAVNAGHEYPALRRKGENFALVKYKHLPVTGVMDGITYKEHEFTMNPGDTLFVYTDGVPEATNAQDQLFGEERMLEALNREPGADPEQLLKSVRASVDAFVQTAPQFDDLTMLCVRMNPEGAE